MRLFRPWSALQRLYPEAVLRIKTQEKMLALTFDDGPDPASTPAILEILSRYGVKANFFCTGIKAGKYPQMISDIKAAGHIVGNHGYSHLSGWKTSKQNYIADVRAADKLTSSQLFRPPYGRLTPWQYNDLKEQYTIILWDLMPYDFDPAFGAVNSLTIMKRMIREGSVIVLHDSPVSCAGVILEEFLNYAMAEGYSFASDPFEVSRGKGCT